MEEKRCAWVRLSNPIYVRYHDEEWGKPLHEDRALYELLILESFQAGLSWECILNKREAFRRAFDGFDPRKVAAYGEEKVEALMQDPGIVRNRRKILAAIRNSAVFLSIQQEWGIRGMNSAEVIVTFGLPEEVLDKPDGMLALTIEHEGSKYLLPIRE